MSRSQTNLAVIKTLGGAVPGWGRSDMGYPLPPALRRGLLFPCWGLTPVLPTLLWVGMGPAGLAVAALSLIFLATGLCSQIFSFHSTAKGYDKTTPWPMVLLRPIPSSWGVPPTNGRASKGPVSQRQLFLGSPGPMMLPPVPFVPPLCVPIAEKGTGTKGVGIMGSPISGPASEWASPHLSTQFNCA